MAVKRKSSYCRFCSSALTDPDLPPDGDFSYFPIGYCSDGYRFMLGSGGGKAVRIELDVRGVDGWHTIGTYFPKHCPMCGRQLKEYFVPDRGDCFCKWSSVISSAPEAARSAAASGARQNERGEE